MKKIGALVFAIAVASCALIMCAPAKTSAQDVEDFTINSFTTDYYLSRTKANVSQMTVDETIVANFPSIDQNHGILRAIPESYRNHPLDLKIMSVTNANGHAWRYTTYQQNGNLVLQIGDANAFVHGDQTYKIDYTTQNVTENFANNDELYWDVNGDQWDQTMNVVKARVHLTKDLAAQFNGQTKCFAGADGSTGSGGCTMNTSADKTLITSQTTAPLSAGETLTFVAGFQPKTFAKYHISLARLALLTTVIGGPIILTGIFLYTRWRRYGRDAKGQGTIVVQYMPPKDASVLLSGMVLKERSDTSHISAQLIDLAVRHYVRIYQTSESHKFRPDRTHYELELIRSLKDLRPEELSAARAIFGDVEPNGTRINVDDLKQRLSSQAKTTALLTQNESVRLGFFVRNPTHVRAQYLTAGVVLIAVTLFSHTGYAIGVGISGALCAATSPLMSARMPKGAALRDYLRGLRVYMQFAEADRIRAVQSPTSELTERVQIDTKDPAQLVKLYERLLPYAMLFGIEQEWAKQFAALYQAPPDWFVGDWVAFNAGYFAGSLLSFTSVAQTAFTVPHSSSGSGFGGGGFAGGGGGGGGGGGW